MPALNRVQRIGAQAITGLFRTVATIIGEAEASIPSVLTRHQTKAAAFWVNLRTLPRTNPLARLHTDGYKRFLSPWQRIAGSLHQIPVAMERIQPYTLAPWETRIPLHLKDGEAPIPDGIQLATSSSARNGMVGLGFAFRDYGPVSYTRTLGPQTEQNTYTAELAAMAMAMTRIPAHAHHMTDHGIDP